MRMAALSPVWHSSAMRVRTICDNLFTVLRFIYPVWILLVVFTRDIVTDTFRAFATGKGHSIDMYAALNALAAALWLYLPAFVANATPVFVGKFSRLAPYRFPLWQAGLGANKSSLGFAAAVVVGTFAGYLQAALTPWTDDLWTWLAWSALISFGAMLGDCVKSYAKRRIGIAPGGPWPVIDGIDYVVGALVFGLPLFVPAWQVALALLVAGPIFSLLANMFSYSVGWKKVWY